MGSRFVRLILHPACDRHWKVVPLRLIRRVDADGRTSEEARNEMNRLGG